MSDAEIIATIRNKYQALSPVMDEHVRRRWAACEALAIGWGGDQISDREKTIASSRGFKESGGRLVSLSFPETRAQRIGNTLIFY